MPLLAKHVSSFHDLGRREDAGEGVIVGRRNWIELVIVALCAAKRLPQHGPADRVDDDDGPAVKNAMRGGPIQTHHRP